ncbi:MAG: GntR family transcriptional regulator [Chloroflexi bacterium]|nr:GntR family transcriptional regulator [Chloroflexota bacterium]
MGDGREAPRQTLRARLRELIASSRAGDRLPSERVLSQRWDAARMTVRHATDALVAEGLVERRHGSGTYVLPRPVVRFLGLTSFTQDMRERGLVPGSRTLAFRTEAADTTTATQLRVTPGHEVLRFTRLRLGSDEPMAIETVRIPATLVPGLGPGDLEGSLYELLARRYRIVPGAAQVTIEPVLPERRIRRLLAIPDHQACLRLRMTDTDTRGRVIMTADCIYRGDRYQLTADVPGAILGSGALGGVGTAVAARRAG